jgi:hypothetical protein
LHWAASRKAGKAPGHIDMKVGFIERMGRPLRRVGSPGMLEQDPGGKRRHLVHFFCALMVAGAIAAAASWLIAPVKPRVHGNLFDSRQEFQAYVAVWVWRRFRPPPPSIV